MPAVSPRGPQLLVLTGAGRRAGCGVRGPNTPDRGAGWREAPCRPRPGRGGHGRKEDRSPGGEAAARLRQREATALLTSAQVNVSFSLSLELLSYQKLPADQMLPGVDVRRHANGEKEMVFAQNLLLEYADQPAQASPGPAPHAPRGAAGQTVLVGRRRWDPHADLRNGSGPGPCPEGPASPGGRLSPRTHPEKYRSSFLPHLSSEPGAVPWGGTRGSRLQDAGEDREGIA